MIRTLQSPWLTALMGCLLYLGVTSTLIRPIHIERVRAAIDQAAGHAIDEPSWKFHNPEFDQWIADLKREKEALATRELQLHELQTRLESERLELNTVTQTVCQLQTEFDKNFIRIKDQEVENLKRQAKVIAGMSPEGAAGMINEMPEDEAVRILFTMKADEASAILDTLSKIGKPEAKRAATLTEKMRHALPPGPAARPKTSPSP